MKRIVSSNTLNKSVCIKDLSEDELQNLPASVTLRTRIPGTTSGIQEFKVVSKDAIINNMDKCFIIDSYWGYAYPRDIYIASKEEVRESYQADIDKLKNAMDRLCRSCIK